MSYITDLLRDYDFKTSPMAITPNSGIYDVSYTILTTTTVSTITDSSSFAYYAGQQEETDFTTNLSSAQQGAITAILEPSDFYSDSFSDVTNVSFASGPNGIIAIGQNTNADSLFVNDSNVADNHVAAETFEYGVGGTTVAEDGDVWLNSQFLDGWSTVSAGTEQYLAILHELGHAMGLKHPDPAGVIVTYGQDTQKYTVMGEDLTFTNPDMANSVHPSGLQLYDILALQSLYGMNWYTRNDDTVYSIGHGFGADATKAFMYTIWDGGGTDVIDATGYSGAEIDLRQGHFSSIGVQGDSGDTAVAFDSGGVDHGNLAIAYFTIIENAIGTGANDIIIGNAWNNVLYGGGGNDLISGDGVTADGDAGFHDANTIADASSNVYSWGPDAIAPAADLSGNDILIGGAGDDYFVGGKGNDVIHGGYVASDITGVASGWDPAGEFTGTNNANGAALSDISYSLDSTADGHDTVDYSYLPVGSANTFGIDVVFEDTTATTLTSVIKGYAGEYGTDTLFSIEMIQGTPWNDTFEGTENLYAYPLGSAGNDTYLFGINGVSGSGSGVNYSSFNSLSAPHISVVFSSSGGIVDKSDAGGSLGEDTLNTNVRAVAGTNGNDTFAGFVPGTGNEFAGLAGNDTYTFNMNDLDAGPTTATVSIDEDSGGSLGNVSVLNFDTVTLDSYGLFGSSSVTHLSYEKWNSGLGVYDVLSVGFYKAGGTGIDTATFGATTFELGGYTDDIITGASGVHIIDGGTGTNTIDYSAATGGVTANLSTGSVSDNGWGYADTLSDISIIIGSDHNDSITGDGTTTTVSYADATSGVTVDLLAGTATGDGSDTLSGVPNVIGSSYDDTITSSSADNVIDGGAGTNTVSYAAASSGVTVDLSAGTATGDGNDPLINIQNVIGSSHDDTLSGASGVDNVLNGGSGTNTVDYSSDVAGVTVDLSAGSATDGSGGTDTLVNIQNVVGSSYDDLIVSGSGDNVIDGGAGSNTVSYEAAVSGVTVDLHGGTATGDGSDTLTNIQNVIGSTYDDTIILNSGDHVIDGGAGTNTVSYAYASSGVTVDLSGGTAAGDGNDTLTNIQNVTGSSHDDALSGASGVDNVLDGGTGTNTVDYSHDVAGVSVDLLAGVATDGGSSTDTLSNIQNVIGSAFDDIIAGDSHDNVLDGGGGTNTIDYSHDPAGVTVDLSMGTATDGWSGTDTLTNFQNVIGSAYDDTITGDSHDNVIVGGAGNDIIDGGGGANTVDYSNDPAGVTVDLSMGTATDGWSNTDTLSNIQNVIGSAYDDTITGDSNDNTFVGGAGDDVIDGGGGINTIDYSHDTSAVTVVLNGGYAWDGFGGFDTLSNIQNVIGSAYADYITGDANDNVIVGGAGDDILDGDGGTNTVDYSHDIAGVTVDLYYGTATDGWGDTDTLYNFQSVIGSAFDDVIHAYGTGVLDGGGGINTVEFQNWAGVTVDLSVNTATEIGIGTETLYNFQNVVGSSGDDTITGDSQNNVLVGGAGSDYLDGGGGINTVDYSYDPSNVTVLLNLGYGYDGYGGIDTLVNIQNITGSAYDDYIVGDSNDNVIIGGAGNDYIDGGSGTNTIDYSHDPAGVAVDLSMGTATDGWSGTDTLSNIQTVIGSHHDDVITGDYATTTISYADALSGVMVDLSAGTATGDGNDTLAGILNVIGSSFDDTIAGDYNNNVIDGGGGINTVDYSHDVGGVSVDLSMGTATDGSFSTDTLLNIQHVIGSAFDDYIVGDTNDNLIVGGAGNDYLDGGSGTNTIDYSYDPAGVTVDLSMGTATDGWGGTDSLYNFQTIIGSHYDDSITGDGTSTVSYETALNGVTVDLSMGTATGDGNDTLSGIANVTGSAYADTITGDSNDNILYGNGGNDYLTGGAGADTFLLKGVTAESGVTTIADFNTADGDKIDISNVISIYDPLTMDINNFVQLTTSGSNTQLKVDTDGSGTSYTQIATIQGVTGLDLATLISDHHLLVAA